MENLKISIITATYNSARNIESCLQSVLRQNYKNIEIVVVDGNSTDNTVALCEAMLKKSTCTYSIISEPDNGIYDALNKGLSRATGDVIGFVHSDDMLSDATILQKISDTLSHTNCDGIYGDLLYVSKDDTSKIIRTWKSKPFKYSYLKYGWMPPHPTLYLKKSVYQHTGLFNTNFTIAADYDFILRLFSKSSFKINYLPSVIVKMRVGGASNKSVGNIQHKMKEDYTALKNNGIGSWASLLFKNLRKIHQFLPFS